MTAFKLFILFTSFLIITIPILLILGCSPSDGIDTFYSKKIYTLSADNQYRQLLSEPVVFVSLTRSSTLSTTTGNFTLIEWNTETSDTLDLHSGNSENITVPLPGLYLITCQATFQADANGRRFLGLRINDSTTNIASQRIPATADGGITPLISHVVSLQANDKIKVVAWQNSGSTLTLDGNVNTNITVTRIPEAGR